MNIKATILTFAMTMALAAVASLEAAARTCATSFVAYEGTPLNLDADFGPRGDLNARFNALRHQGTAAPALPTGRTFAHVPTARTQTAVAPREHIALGNSRAFVDPLGGQHATPPSPYGSGLGIQRAQEAIPVSPIYEKFLLAENRTL